MKKLVVFTISALLFASLANFTRADMYGVSISDDNLYNDGNNLYQLFNKYFAEQLRPGGDFEDEGFYESSNDLFNVHGVDPNTNWVTDNSQLVGGFKVAKLGHVMSLFASDGTLIGEIVNMSGTNEIWASDGITDLSGSDITDIADGLHVSFQLDTFNGSAPVNSWWSNPEKNNNKEIHMIALEITDLYNAKHGTDNKSVYMFGWEDLPSAPFGNIYAADWDYQDFVVIMTNLDPGTTIMSHSPEPATMLILGLGLGAIPLSRRFRKRA